MGKKKFLELFTLASQRLPSKAEKSARGDDYSGRQILRRKNEDNKAKLRGKSHPKSASTGRKSSRRGFSFILSFVLIS